MNAHDSESTHREFSIRAAQARDTAALIEMIRELAEYERLLDAVVATADDLRQSLFGAHACAEALIAESGGGVAGFALFFSTFSTFVGRPGLYLEDLFVRPAFRRLGIGRALLQRIAAMAVLRNCGRLEWSVLNWNEPAIEFYRSLGAAPLSDWTTFRLDAEALRRVGE
jgi:GNAT superfamily N-acetyltransferase